MRIRQNEEAEEPLLAMTSLLDIMFILIIFFLVAATFKQEERDVQVNLPRADDSAALSAAPRVIVINVRPSGDYVVGGEEMDLARVLRVVRKALIDDPLQKVLIRGDRAARHEFVAGAVRACRQAGVSQANIGYDAVPTP